MTSLRETLVACLRDAYENGAPVRDEHGEPTGERAKLPVTYLPLFEEQG